MRFHTTEQIGPTQSITPEGFLLCSGVPIARTGEQLYAAHELPELLSGDDGLIRVIRDEAEVFRPETIASFEGKSVTINHAFVDPGNVRYVEVGHAQNVRRSDTEPDLLLADLLIKDAGAIERVKTKYDVQGRMIDSELREISCGYDADYEQITPGVARQCNIIGNHVAILKHGRAGPRCSIQDEEIMTTKTTTTLLSRLLRAARTGDVALIRRTADEAEAEVTEAQQMADAEAAEAERKKTADAITSIVKTVDELTKTVAELVKTRDGATTPPVQTDAEKTRTADAMRDTATRAEILVPGFTMPTTDSVPDMSAVTVLQRKVLADAAKTEDGKGIVTPLLAGRTLDALPDDAVETVFIAASEMARANNNSRGSVRGVATSDFDKAPVSIAEMNKRNADFWAKR